MPLPKANATQREWNQLLIAARGELERLARVDANGEYSRVNRVVYLYDAGDRSPGCLAKLQEIADNLGECDECGARLPFDELYTVRVPATGEAQVCDACAFPEAPR